MSDGDLARFYKSFSIRGSYWDSVIHSVVNPLFHISICFSYYMIFQKIEILFFSPFFALSSSVLIAVKNNYFKALFKNKILIETDVNESTKLRNYKIYFLITEFLSIEGLILTTIFVKYYAIFEIAVIQLLIFFIANISASLIKFYNFSYKGKTFKKY